MAKPETNIYGAIAVKASLLGVVMISASCGKKEKPIATTAEPPRIIVEPSRHPFFQHGEKAYEVASTGEPVQEIAEDKLPENIRKAVNADNGGEVNYYPGYSEEKFKIINQMANPDPEFYTVQRIGNISANGFKNLMALPYDELTFFTKGLLKLPEGEERVWAYINVLSDKQNLYSDDKQMVHRIGEVRERFIMTLNARGAAVNELEDEQTAKLLSMTDKEIQRKAVGLTPYGLGESIKALGSYARRNEHGRSRAIEVQNMYIDYFELVSSEFKGSALQESWAEFIAYGNNKNSNLMSI